jgi:hypothetical protein
LTSIIFFSPQRYRILLSGDRPSRQRWVSFYAWDNSCWIFQNWFSFANCIVLLGFQVHVTSFTKLLILVFPGEWSISIFSQFVVRLLHWFSQVVKKLQATWNISDLLRGCQQHFFSQFESTKLKEYCQNKRCNTPDSPIKLKKKCEHKLSAAI